MCCSRCTVKVVECRAQNVKCAVTPFIMLQERRQERQDATTPLGYIFIAWQYDSIRNAYAIGIGSVGFHDPKKFNGLGCPRSSSFFLSVGHSCTSRMISATVVAYLSPNTLGSPALTGDPRSRPGQPHHVSLLQSPGIARQQMSTPPQSCDFNAAAERLGPSDIQNSDTSLRVPVPTTCDRSRSTCASTCAHNL
jgi:hypothetical protein